MFSSLVVKVGIIDSLFSRYRLSLVVVIDSVFSNRVVKEGIIDSLFSIDGDVAPIQELLKRAGINTVFWMV
jgi:hypothetical protein